ncbi:MAG: hypothetical protein DRQ51_10485 [Gammaproteobacteria bacterium]|nr:MAG: hypothetical protein DRQ51_10485 [Gammaproteobacteria bacterium]
MKNENSIFVYKMTADNGGAPCVHDGLLSLCICKPDIRKAAKGGDWIIGMGGTSVSDLKDRVIYVAKVKDRIDGSEYYKEQKYKNRPDCIYQFNDEIYEYKKNAIYHDDPDCLEHDLGKKENNYDRAICLISDEFIYFGDNDKPTIDTIKDIYDNLPRNYKQNHDENIFNRLNNFIMELKKEYSYGHHGNPTHKDTSKKCGESEHGGVSNYSKRQKQCQKKQF